MHCASQSRGLLEHRRTSASCANIVEGYYSSRGAKTKIYRRRDKIIPLRVDERETAQIVSEDAIVAELSSNSAIERAADYRNVDWRQSAAEVEQISRVGSCIGRRSL